MIKKIIGILLTLTVVMSLCSCGNNQSDTKDIENINPETSKTEKNSTKNEAIAVTDLRVESDGDRLYVFGTVEKKSDEIERSNVDVRCEVFDDKGEYIGIVHLNTESTLSVGDTENVSDEIWGYDGEEYSDDVLKKWTVEIDKIEEIDADEAEKQQAIADIISEIEWKIEYDEEYNTALTMLEMAKEEYPDSKELKLFEAQVKDMFAEKGISMDGESVPTEIEEF